MKRLLQTIMVIICAIPAMAQFKTVIPEDAPMAESILREQMRGDNINAPASISSRLVSYHNKQQGIVWDSIHYYYSGQRGSHLDRLQDYDQEVLSYYALPNTEKQLVFCDSQRRWGLTPELESVPVSTAYYTYNAANRTTNIQIGSPYPLFAEQHKLFYNNDGSIAHFELYLDDGATLFEKTFSTYNSSGKKLTDSTFNYEWTNSPSIKLVYEYNGTGLLARRTTYVWDISNQWLLSDRFNYAYDNQQRLSSVTEQLYEEGTWLDKSKNGYTYTGNSTHFNGFIKYMWHKAQGYWQPRVSAAYEFNSEQQPAIVILSENLGDGSMTNPPVGNTLTPMLKTLQEYHADGYLERRKSYLYAGGVCDTIMDGIEYWNYEVYEDGTTGIGKKTLAGEDVRVYPNPASDLVYIDAAGSISIRSVTCFNYLGQVVLKTQPQSRSKIVLNVSGLSAGVYLADIYSDQGKVSKKFTVVK